MFYLNSFCNSIKKNFRKLSLSWAGLAVMALFTRQSLRGLLTCHPFEKDGIPFFSLHFPSRVTQRLQRKPKFHSLSLLVPPAHPLMSTFATALCRMCFFYYWKHQTKRKAGTKQNAQKQITHQNVLSQHLYQRLRCPGPCELRPYLLWCLYLFLLMQANEGNQAERVAKNEN